MENPETLSAEQSGGSLERVVRPGRFFENRAETIHKYITPLVTSDGSNEFKVRQLVAWHAEMELARAFFREVLGIKAPYVIRESHDDVCYEITQLTGEQGWCPMFTGCEPRPNATSSPAAVGAERKHEQ